MFADCKNFLITENWILAENLTFTVLLYAVLYGSKTSTLLNVYHIATTILPLYLENQLATKDQQRKNAKKYWFHHYVVYPQPAQASLVWLYFKDRQRGILKSLLYSEVVVDRHNCSRATLRFKDVCKLDLNVRNGKW